MNFIEELYYGNIKPSEKRYDRDSQYAKALELFCKNEKILSDTLEGDTLKLFNRLVDASDEISACTGAENFKLGFILGVQLMADCFKYDGGTIFRDV
jgi:hypothetical protein